MPKLFFNFFIFRVAFTANGGNMSIDGCVSGTRNVPRDNRKRNDIMTTNRKPRTRKPATVPASPIDAIVAIARTVTVANIIDVVRRACANHGVTARNVGRYTGMRVMAFQNHTFAANVAWQLDDVQLLALWTMEFPAAVGRVFALNGRMGTPDVRAIADGIGIVRGVRSDYNRTGHGMATGKPATASESYGTKRFDIPVPAATVVSTPDVKPAATKTPRVRKPAAKTVAA